MDDLGKFLNEQMQDLEFTAEYEALQPRYEAAAVLGNVVLPKLFGNDCPSKFNVGTADCRLCAVGGILRAPYGEKTRC